LRPYIPATTQGQAARYSRCEVSRVTEAVPNPPRRFLLWRVRGRSWVRDVSLFGQDVSRLLAAAHRLAPTYGLRPWTYYCFFGLLAVTGLRLSEALNLQCQDIDWAEGLLTIRKTKFGKSRLIPLHASSVKVLAAYAKRRARFLAQGGMVPSSILRDEVRHPAAGGIRVSGCSGLSRNGSACAMAPPVINAAARSPPSIRHQDLAALVSRRGKS